MKSKALLFAGIFLVPQLAFGECTGTSRTLIVPQFNWTNWLSVNDNARGTCAPNPCGWGGNAAAMVCVDVTITNAGTTPTSAYVLASPAANMFGTSSNSNVNASIGSVLTAGCWPGSGCTTYAINNSTVVSSSTGTLSPGASAILPVCAVYQGINGTCSQPNCVGAWQLPGSLGVQVQVCSSSGAVTGTMRSRMELAINTDGGNTVTSAPPAAPTPDTLANVPVNAVTPSWYGSWMAIRNVSVFKDLNGGRAF